MTKEVTVYYRNGDSKKIELPDNLYDLPWSKYRRIERKVKMNAEVNRDGEIMALNVDSSQMGEFLVEYQETLAEVLLSEENIDLDDVTTQTVKNVLNAYSDEIEDEHKLQLKKN